MNKQKAELGTISHATMLPRDLIPAFADELERIDTEDQYLGLQADVAALTERDYESDKQETIDNVDGILEELFAALDVFSPPYCYFGSHEGDGSDYGFWISWDAINDDVACGDILKVNDLADIIPGWKSHVLLVNDHGNASLYQPRIEWHAVWECV